ncbi:hypothetical protein PHMEG_00026552 [Phytophthora megakarya]|uniref:Uncharacterized protein n=1 Tax=Phytophthora megakarya TaxID=4795 RepID=A0A225V908_9STRA|nr:hypothetical protein PHMEG_00026552 [Phytophthora megakarya]
MGFHPVELLLLVEALGIFTDRYGTAHVLLEDSESVTIGLAGSKNDQYGRGAWRTMHAAGDPLLCPIKALRHIHKARQELKCERERCSKRSLCRKNSYSTHSIRFGGATALLSGKADSLSIKLLGRWMSECFEENLVQAVQATIGLSCRMI